MTTNCTRSESGLVSREIGQLSNLQSKEQLVSFLATVKGKDIFGRYSPALTYIDQNERDGLAVENRGLQSAPGTTTTASDQAATQYYGDNFASNNYLGLAQHPATVDAAIDAATTFGVNSAGSPLAFGATKYFMQLKEEIGEFWGCKALIYSSGWLSGYGTIKALIKDYDHVIIDEFADNSLLEGALAATKNVHRNRHLDEAQVAALLKQIRDKDTENAIFVVTEGIFPLDSASPNLVNLQRVAKQHQAFLAVGCGHDFGVVGAGGRGVWE
jgi:glycine C-acetyltransferase